MASLADIAVKMSLDDSQFTSGLKQAESQAKTSTNNIKNYADGASGAFSHIKTAIAGIGFATLATDSLKLASTIKGLSDSTGLSIAQVQGWRQAVVAAGGDADNAGDALVDLTQKMNEAVNSGGDVATSFAAVGVSMNDLRTQTSADIYGKVIDGLAKFKDANEASRHSNVLMGEDMKRVNFDVMAENLKKYTDAAKGSEGAITSAAAANNNLKVAGENVQIALLNAIQPLTDMAVKLSKFTVDASNVIQSLISLGAVLFLGFGGFKKLEEILFSVSSSLLMFGAKVRHGSVSLTDFANSTNPVVTTLSNIGKSLSISGLAFDRLWKGLTKPIKVTVDVSDLDRARKVYEHFGSRDENFVGPSKFVLAEANGLQKTISVIGSLTTGVIAFASGLGEAYLVLLTIIEGAKLLSSIFEYFTGIDLADKFDSWSKGLSGTRKEREHIKEIAEKQAEEEERVKKAIEAQTKLVTDLGIELRGITNSLEMSNTQQLKSIELASSLVGVGDNQKQILTSVNDLENQRLQAVQSLYDKMIEMDKQSTLDLAAQTKIQAAIDDVNQKYEEQKQAVAEALVVQGKMEQGQRAVTFAIEQGYAAQQRIKDIQAETAGVFLPTIAKRYKDIEKAASDAAQAQLQSEATTRGTTVENLPKDYVQRIQDAAAAQVSAEKEVALEQEKTLQLRRLQTFATGELSAAQDRVNQLNADSANLFLPLIEQKYRAIEKAAQDSTKAEIEREAAARNITPAQLQQQDPSAIAAIKDAANARVAAEKEATANADAAYNKKQLQLFQNKELVASEAKLADVRANMNMSTMSEYEKIAYKIQVDAKATAKAEIAAEEARRGSALSEKERLAYYDAALKGTQELTAAEQEAYNNSRSFSTGWKQAMNEYVTNATDSAAQAKSLFSKTFKGMEDMIVSFAKTGKFSWKEFVASLVEELLRAQIVKLFSGMMGDINGQVQNAQQSWGNNNQQQSGGIGSLVGGIGNLFGGSSSNNNSSSGGMFSSIGNWASDLFGGSSSNNNSSSGGMFSSIGNWASDLFGGSSSKQQSLPSGWGNNDFNFSSGGYGGSSGGGFWDSVGSGLSSIGSGVSDFFSGWFADGGTIPSGKWGIAGEAGPEVITGPATVTPMSNLGNPVNSTNVTYNINAVDALSFKQLLASDPSFIYALSLQGSQGIARAR